jgi:hypothetical protein
VADKSASVADSASPSFAGGHYGQTRFPIEHRPPPVARHRSGGGYAAIALRADRVDAALADTVELPALTPEVPPLNVCAATARRLLEICRRNELRREAKLPLLPIAKELRRIKLQEDLEEFERFEAAYGRLCGRRCKRPAEKRRAI